MLQTEGYKVEHDLILDQEKFQRQLEELKKHELYTSPPLVERDRERLISTIQKLKKRRSGLPSSQSNAFSNEEFKAKFIALMKSKIDYRTIGQYLVNKCNNSIFKATQLNVEITKLKYLILGQETHLSPKDFSVLILYPYKGYIRTDIWK